MNLTAILLATLVINDIPSGSSKDLEARWRLEYPAAVEKWNGIMKNFSAKGIHSFHWNDASTSVIGDLTVAALGDRRLYIAEKKLTQSPKHPDRIDAATARCRTPEYLFDLRKDASTSRYILIDYQKNEEDSESQFYYWYNQFVENATVYLGRSLKERMADLSFSLRSIEALKLNGEDLVRIDYTCETKYANEAGVVDLDPRKNWAILSVDLLSTFKKTNFDTLSKKW